LNPPAAAALPVADHPALAAALAALSALPAPEPVPAVSMNAEGHLLIVGDADVALGWAERLAGQRQVTVLALGNANATVDPENEAIFTVEPAAEVRLTGHLGAFVASWQSAGASKNASFDVVLDLSPTPLLNRVELPPGYAAPGRDPLDQALASHRPCSAFDGEFEKPRYVAVNERVCAHSRSQKTGCSNCLDVCATEAIVSAGDTIRLDPYLCQGCGTCTTVCPTGALAYQYPRVADLGVAIKMQLKAYREAGGQNPCLLFHSAEAGRKVLLTLKRSGQTLPANVIPVETWSADAVGLDLLLGAMALGARQVAVLGCRLARPGAAAPAGQAGRQAILNGLGYAGDHLRIVDAERTRWLANSPTGPSRRRGVPPAEFRLLADKRTTLEFVIDHLAKHAPARRRSHRAAGRRAVRQRRRQRRLHAVHGLHQRLPGQRAEGGRRCAAPLLP
jgi:ferredoxin